MNSSAYLSDATWPEYTPSGPSNELINPVLDSSNGSNWKLSSQQYGTPGELNSQFEAEHIGFYGFQRDIIYPLSSDPITLSVTVSADMTFSNVSPWVNPGTGFFQYPMTQVAGTKKWQVVPPQIADQSLVRFHWLHMVHLASRILFTPVRHQP